MIEWLHPGLLLIFGSLLVPLLKDRVRKVYLVILAGAALVDCLMLSPGRYGIVRFMDYQLVFGRVDKLSLVFAYVFCIMALIGVVYSLHVKESGQHMAALIYAGSSLGVVFAGDFFTLFIFWELMAFSSVFLIWYRKSATAIATGFRYLLVHAFGGVCLLGGIVLYLRQTGSLTFESLTAYSGSLAFNFILIGFILNAAVPPLSAWLSDAYPEATVTGTVFMSAYTTKTAVYVLVRGFPGTELLIWLGAIMALYGVVYAVLENDCRRLLAYHIISQVGYMVVGVGIGTEMSLNGTVAHAFSHILYKALLLMGAGAVIHVTGVRKLSQLGGLYKTMPVTLTLYMIGAFSISAFPLFSGFVSKSMVVSSAGEAHLPVIFILLTIASVGTFLHTGLKLPYYVFFGKDSGIKAKEPPVNMLIGMGMAAFLCIYIGIFYKGLYSVLPNPVNYSPYTIHHLVFTTELLMFTAVGFFLLLKHLEPTATITLDTDWFYRRGARAFMWLVEKPLAAFEFGVVTRLYLIFLVPVKKLAPILSVFDRKVVDGAVNGVARLALSGGQAFSSLQNGRYGWYALVMAFGLASLLTLAILIF